MNKSIYKQRENAIPFESKTKLITIPQLMSIFLMVFIPQILDLCVGSLLEIPEGQLISLPMTIEMILSVLISIFIIRAC